MSDKRSPMRGKPHALAVPGRFRQQLRRPGTSYFVPLQGGSTMPNLDELQRWHGRDLIDRDGDKIGSIGDVYLDDQTGQPEWLTVKTGLFGNKESFVPTAEARSEGDTVR